MSFDFNSELYADPNLAEGVGYGRVTEASPRATLDFLTPAVAVEQPAEPTPRDIDYWLRRSPDHEQA